jgi:hypothetical protein
VSSNHNRRTSRYRLTTSLAAGVLLAVILGVVSNEHVKHHHGGALALSGAVFAGAVVAVVMFVLWSVGAAFRRAGHRARERERERDQQTSRKPARRGSRYGYGR